MKIIAGPCAIEGREMAYRTAEQVAIQQDKFKNFEFVNWNVMILKKYFIF